MSKFVRRMAIALVPIVVITGIQQPAWSAPATGHDAPAAQKQSPPARGQALTTRPHSAKNPTRDAALKAPPAVRWPGGGQADLAQASAATAVGGLPVRLKTGRAHLKVLDRTASTRLGQTGPVVTMGGTGTVNVELGYGTFTDAFGGDYGARLRLVKLPGCALTTPDVAACQKGTPVASVNDTAKRTVSASVAATSVVALEAGDTSTQGDYAATKLSASAKWDVALSSGNLTWSYPIQTPPTPGNLGPKIELGYSSQSVDGKTANTNNQGSWVGEGFTYEPGYVERRYKPCADDGHENVGDQCWARQNASIVFGGISGELVRVNDDLWKLSNDDGTKVERLTGATNGDNDGEYWKATTPDGTQYFFGMNRLPGRPADGAETNSTWTAPVSGDDDDEPCHKSSGWDDSFCDQGWRWNLDYVKDPHNNVISYWYQQETNYYAKRAKTDVNGTKYVRGGYLLRADYGQTDGAVFSTKAPARVRFDTAERCIPTDTFDCGADALTDAKANQWPDTPWDMNCKASTKCKIGQASETFWTRKRLSAITTEIRSGSSWTPVERWNLEHKFTDNGDGSKTLWLDKIQHTGLFGGTVTTPPVEFVGIQMPNRVDSDKDMLAPLNRYRLNTIWTETGGEIQINYTPQECDADNLPAEGKSTKRCFPVKWNPFDPKKPYTDWFNKYLVAQVIQVDRTGGNPDQVTQYEYPANSAGWRKTDPDGITKSDYRTWGEWRGYPKVTVRTGDMQTLPTKVEHYFFRGLEGDKVSDSTGVEYTDADVLAGQELETITYDGAKVVTKTINEPKYWTTYTQTETWGSNKSTVVRADTSRKYIALDGGAWRQTRSDTTYDTTWGRVTQVDDLGDTSTSDDDVCTRTSYADNADLFRYTYEKLVETFSVKCSVTPNRATDLMSSDRTSYDGKDYGVAPTKGSATRSEKLDTATATATTYLSTETVVDGFGRPTKVTDPMGYAVDTTYTDVDGLNTQVKETNVLNQSTTTDYSPSYGQKTGVTDPNDKRTDLEYDGLGRLVKAWLPIRPKAAGNTPELKYTYTVRNDKPVVTKTETIQNNGTYKVSYQLFDGFLRDRQTQNEGPDGGWLLTDTLWTSTGQKAQTNNSYFATGTPGDKVVIVPEGSVNGQTKYEYDGANRVKAEITAVSGDEKWRSVTAYHGDRTDVDPPAGGTATTTVTDVQGRTTALYQYLGGSPTGDSQVTRYKYTPDGDPESVTGPDGAEWRWEYFQNGNKSKFVDPDAGTTSYTYDKNGNQTSTTDSRKLVVSDVYDKLNRKIESWQGAPVTGTKLAAWVYDTYYKGQVAGTARYVDAKTAYYVTYPIRDAQYRALKTSYIVPSDAGAELAKTYDFSTSYNLDGTTQTVGMPAAGDLPAENITVGYDGLSRPTTLDGTSSYVTATNYANTGELLQATLWTGGTNKKAWQTWSYERGTTRLTGIRLDRQNAPIVDLDAKYNYDAAGNVQSIVDTPAGATNDVQCFTYDGLRRLTEAWSTASTDCQGVGGSAPYHEKWDFYPSGDRKTETRFSATGGADTVRSYKYAAAQPHSLRQVDQVTGTVTGTSTYTPDSAGNTVARDQQALTFDAEGHLAKSVQNGQPTSFLYDADGERLVRKEPGFTTLYLDGMELRLNQASKQVTATRFYEFAEKTIAVRTGAGVAFLTSDAHGTGSAAVNAVTGAITWQRTTPYGGARGVAPTIWPSQKGFVGGTVDSTTGLTHLGAREYDTGIGRFLSVDPEFDSKEPQSLGGYLYANNSPLAFSDPTGRSWGWVAVAAVAIVVVAVVVAIACPAVIPALIAAGSAAAEAGGVAAASGAGVAATATTAAVAGAAELSIAGGAAVGAGVVGTGLTVAGVGGRIYAGTEDGPAVPAKPKAPPAGPRGPQRGDSQNTPGGQKGPALTIDQVKRKMGEAGLPDVSEYDIEAVPHIEQPNGGSAWGDSPAAHGAYEHGRHISIPQTGKRGRPLIRVAHKTLNSWEQSVKTIHHEVWHHKTQLQMGEHFEQQAEAYGERMWWMFARRNRGWL